MQASSPRASPWSDFYISNDLVARLSALGHSRGATLFMTLLAASRRYCCSEADAMTFASRP